jgi:hypothetical protein
MELQSVKINIGSNMYSRFPDLPNTVPHVLAEFVDNALQSYYDNKEALLKVDSNFKLVVKIDIEWDDITNRATKIVISDNAAGINEHIYESAFMPAKTPENNSGLNEFGMGLKTAALWLGETWVVNTKALYENVERTITFNLNEVTANDLEELPIETIEKAPSEHYTVVTITDPTKNSPARRNLDKIRNDLASIYRKSLRSNEMQIVVCDESLSFAEYPVLVAPPAGDNSAAPITWKKEVNFSFGKYKATGFIGILRDIDSTKNGFVLLRRGRVIVGAEYDGRYFPKMSGSSGTFKYKRLFGELELEGFDVSFNKNAIQDKDNLEALMDALKDEIRTPEFDIFKQAEDYRLNESQKAVNKLVKKHNNNVKKATPIAISTQTKKQQEEQPLHDTTPQETPPIHPEIVLGETVDEYRIDGKNYKLNVEFVNTGNELFWSDVSHKAEGVIVCKINTDHVFFRHFGNPTDSVIAIIKTIAISKFAANTSCNGSANEMLDLFNEFIKQTKV